MLILSKGPGLAPRAGYWPTSFDNMKSGLVGGHLRIANVGAYSASAVSGGRGFELVALADASFHRGDQNGGSSQEDESETDRAGDGSPRLRLPNINYSPAVYVRLREEPAAAASSAGFRYFRAANSSLRNVSAAEFYSNLEAFLAHQDVTFGADVATLRLPGPEGRRQTAVKVGR